jgi:RimJ/RimL family protein N-acetyltransferase
MTSHINEFGQAIGFPLDFTGPWPRPQGITFTGRTYYLKRAAPEHARELFDCYSLDTSGKNWTYMPTSPARAFAEFEAWFLSTCLGDDFLFYTVFDRDARAIGIACYLRINPSVGSTEVGWISMSPLMQRTVMSTEAMYLMMRHVFDDLGYRRYEWKCDSLNAQSRVTAQRLGFQFEGIFRSCTHYKGRNRDTAWFAIIDSDWPALEARFTAYLDPTNFDAQDQQIRRLLDF